VAGLLGGIKRLRERHGTLENAFAFGLGARDRSTVPALASFVDGLQDGSSSARNSLLPCPRAGSACKRLHLYLRWMVRSDRVDPGCWPRVSPALLVVPVDTHMFRIARNLGLTARRQADLKTALEITHAFKRFAPDDPARYDFALTRLGMTGAAADLLQGS
jgi:uncharacterized protein (TIGR02757 family)